MRGQQDSFRYHEITPSTKPIAIRLPRATFRVADDSPTAQNLMPQASMSVPCRSTWIRLPADLVKWLPSYGDEYPALGLYASNLQLDSEISIRRARGNGDVELALAGED